MHNLIVPIESRVSVRFSMCVALWWLDTAKPLPNGSVMMLSCTRPVWRLYSTLLTEALFTQLSVWVGLYSVSPCYPFHVLCRVYIWSSIRWDTEATLVAKLHTGLDECSLYIQHRLWSGYQVRIFLCEQCRNACVPISVCVLCHAHLYVFFVHVRCTNQYWLLCYVRIVVLIPGLGANLEPWTLVAVSGSRMVQQTGL